MKLKRIIGITALLGKRLVDRQRVFDEVHGHHATIEQTGADGRFLIGG
jgi:hypothetical protein